MVTRHIDQLRTIGESVPNDNYTPNILIPPPHILIPPPSIPQNVPAAADPSFVDSDSVNQKNENANNAISGSPPHAIRQSTRIRKPVDRLNYD